MKKCRASSVKTPNIFSLAGGYMKNLSFFIAIIFLSGVFSCNKDGNKNQINNLMLAAAANRVLVTISGYNTSNTLLMYQEIVYDSKSAFQQSFTYDINNQLMLHGFDMVSPGYTSSYKMSQNKGPDGIWFTADDTNSMDVSIETASNNTKRITNRINATIMNYLIYTLDSYGRLTGYTLYSGNGPNNTWFDSDDPVGGYGQITWADSDHAHLNTLQANGITITAQYDAYRDIVNNKIYHITYNAVLITQTTTVKDFTNNRTISYNSQEAPANVTSYLQFTLDSEKRILTQTYYDGNGGDGTWFNGNDHLGVNPYVTYQYNTEGYLTGMKVYSDIGVTLTGNYVITYRMIY
jgi:hypothetical protein